MMKNLRIFRVVIVLVILYFAYAFMNAISKDSKIIGSISKDMTTLSAKLNQQQNQVEKLNKTLGNFIGELDKLQRNVYEIRRTVDTSDQTTSHALDKISEMLLNMKSKVDMLSGQNSRSFYR